MLTRLPPFLQAIGSDRHLTRTELVGGAGDHAHLTRAWSLYQQSFGGFCETGLDPQFHRLAHPAQSAGSLALDASDPVLVVGTGPSTLQALPALARVKDRLWLFTSPRGAELLASHGLAPDLILIEHRTALDAQHSARHLLDAGRGPLEVAPLVAADWRTPAALLGGVMPARVFVPDPLPTWGLWPATAAAMAVNAGAARIGLLGVDLGTTDLPDPAFAPLRLLLGLIVDLSGAAAVDCGPTGARKPGWSVGSLESLASDHPVGALGVERRAAPTPEERRACARHGLRRISKLVTRARHILAMALRIRAGAADVRGLEAGARDLLEWGLDRQTRIDLQEVLGLGFLPRFWRTGIDLSLGPLLWRPLVLATHEMVGQADRLSAIVRKAAA